MKQKGVSAWSRQPKETDAAWQAFLVYRDLPYEKGTKRSIVKATEVLGKSECLLDRWSARWNWVERATAYDRYMDDLKIEERVKSEQKEADQERKMDERHIALSGRMQRLLLDSIDTIKTEDLSPKGLADLARALQIVASVERESRHSTTADRQLELAIKRFEREVEREEQYESADGLLPDLIRELQDE